MISREEKFARLRLIRSKKIGNAIYWTLLDLYKDAVTAIKFLPELAYRATENTYDLCDKESIEKEIFNLKSIGGRMIFFEDELYPNLLRQTESPPPIITLLGNKEIFKKLLNQKLLSVVGSRNASLNSLKLCFAVCRELSENGIGIVSGFARGIDTSAHNGSLENGTIAVLAGGINQIYPPENADLYMKIAEKGGIIAEMPYDTYPIANLFPRRNNIIAGVSDGVLIVEAAKKSGSLITAKMSKLYNRKIFAVPNSPMDSRSQGCNELIKNGAHVVTNTSDILDAFSYHFQEAPENNELFEKAENINYKFKARSITSIKKIILNLIDAYSLSIPELINTIDSPPSKILQSVIELELSGKISRIHGNKIIYSGNVKS